MNILDCFPSRFVKAHQLGGRDVIVTIADVVIEEMGRPGADVEYKPVVYFEKATKGLILNRVNARTIAALYGEETDNWRGQRITLYPTRINAFGAQHDVIRVREKAPARSVNDVDVVSDHDDVADPEDTHDEIDFMNTGTKGGEE